jgi:hypothetical protein
MNQILLNVLVTALTRLSPCNIQISIIQKTCSFPRPASCIVVQQQA